jgi:probable F420-dependent oxidoreductase
VEFGVATYMTDDGIDPVTLAQAAEAHGFESIFCPDHTHVPASRETPFPAVVDQTRTPGELPREYYRMRDPLVTLAGMASVTTSLKLGTGVCLVPQRDPIILAKQVATLDLASGGRVLFGIGAGWNREEMRNHGTDPRTRMALMEERVEAMKRIWAEDRAEFHGRFVDFDPLFSWPKPLQRPHPPIIVGGMGPGVLDRVLAYGDGWFPGHGPDLGALAARIDELQERAAAAGREPIPVSLIFARPDHLDRYEEMGIARCVFMLPAGPPDDVLAEVARLARVALPA